ncbi:MAG: SAM-dependent methyltransferase, partial [Alphaproteobacteria bacterium HGW-Alphaproteobacteria-2]
MQRAARLAAAAEVLDTVLAGQPAEQALINWARGHRFAGSGDREAIRNSVFSALRCLRSHAALGGAETGRGLILGQMAEAGEDVAALFTGEGHAPAPLTDAERAHLAGPPEMPRNVALDCPDWLAPQLEASLGADFAQVMQALRRRAPVFLRVNAARCTRDEAAARLAAEGVETQPAPLAETALEVTAGARGLRATRAYTEGLVELQDAASQAVAAALPLAPGASVL